MLRGPSRPVPANLFIQLCRILASHRFMLATTISRVDNSVFISMLYGGVHLWAEGRQYQPQSQWHFERLALQAVLWKCWGLDFVRVRYCRTRMESSEVLANAYCGLKVSSAKANDTAEPPLHLSL